MKASSGSVRYVILWRLTVMLREESYQMFIAEEDVGIT